MIGYDPWHWRTQDYANRVNKKAAKKANGSACTSMSIRVEIVESSHRDALIDIAHDCGTLEAAQRRAKEALKPRKKGKHGTDRH